jgi:alkylation response protein AidB-like acyl-CoA dehydrogenase
MDISTWQQAATEGPAPFEELCDRFFGQHGSQRTAESFVWGTGSDNVALFDEQTVELERVEIARARAWQETIFEAGAGWLSGPQEFGGAGLAAQFEQIFRDKERNYDLPSRAALGIGTTMVGPTVHLFGSEAAKTAILPKIFRGEAIACELFSEPGAGSDLANARTSAVRVGSQWRLNGQKVWTSGAHYSDVGQAICRTNPDAPKHLGTTVFLIDMHAPGVAVRPLRQMTGGARFNEVFLDDVMVDDEYRLGDVDDGWNVTRHTLLLERSSMARGEGRANTEVFRTDRLVALLRHLGLDQDDVHRQRLADLIVHTSVARFATAAAIAALRDDDLPGPEFSRGKLALTENYRRLSELAVGALGPSSAADTGDWGTFAWSQLTLGQHGFGIAGGTTEIVRTMLAERVLGMPRRP